jgi:universal stress protein A
MARYRHILAAVDLAERSQRTVAQAVRLARACNCRLSILHVSPRRLSETGRAELLAEISGLLPVGDTDLDAHIHVSTGRPVAQILAFAAAHDVDLIVFGNPPRHDLARAFVESVGERLSEGALCSVLAVPSASPATLGAANRDGAVATIVCAVDLHETSADTLDAAASLARATGAELVVMHVIEPWRWAEAPLAAPTVVNEICDGLERDAKDQLTHLLAGQDDTKATALVVVGLSSSRILEEAARRHAGLLVLGAHSTSVLGLQFIGAAAETALASATCPVLLVRPHAEVARVPVTPSLERVDVLPRAVPTRGTPCGVA